MSFEGIRNFRDIGGYAGADGRQVARDRLFRSAATDKATPGDLAQLEALGIGTYVDLRHWSEREAAPALRPEGFEGDVVEILEQDRMEAPHERYLGGDDLSIAGVRPLILHFYRQAPYDPKLIGIFGRTIRAVADADAPVLIHCAVGKDRTGLIVALIHHILGVSPADQIADYLLTREDRTLIDRVNARLIAFVESRGKVMTLDAAEAMSSVFAENMEESWAAIRERDGSVDGYLERMLGVGPEVRAALREKYLA